MPAPASDFQKVISDARERKRNEALAERIFSRGRRQSAPSDLKPRPGGSLASRVGVNKQRGPSSNSSASLKARRASVPAGNVDGEWIHDLHDSVRGQPSLPLGARIHAPGSRPPAARKNTAGQRRARLASAVDRLDLGQINVGNTSRAGDMGIAIRGLAGPMAVMAQNFAPGTTTADIETAMTPIGGEIMNCKIIKTVPFVLAEMVFASREGGERVIERFNDRPADGRILKVYPKVGGYQASMPTANSPYSPRAARNSPRDLTLDGSAGLSGDLMDMDNNSSNSSSRPVLYSDKIVARNRWVRGDRRGW